MRLTTNCYATADHLPSFARETMESLFKSSFADVRLRIGPQPASIGAQAFVQGSDLYFSPGFFEPQSPEGLRLLAHELTHVIQQRSRRVTGAFETNAGIVEDPALEEEADWMGEQAARLSLQLPPPASRSSRSWFSGFHLCRPFQTSEGRYQIAAGWDGNLAGSVTVEERDRNTIGISNLEVEARFRRRGLGRALVVSALETGMHLGRREAMLISADRGSGRLTRWYERLGFQQIGCDSGYPELRASIGRALSRFPSLIAPPIAGSWIQCADDKKAIRLKRFGKQHAKLSRQETKHLEKVGKLRDEVEILRGKVFNDKVGVVPFGSRVDEHGYTRDEAKDKFKSSFLSTSDWENIEAAKEEDGKLVVTVRLANGETVTGSWKHGDDEVKVFHCGKTASGVGYGTPLG